MFSRDLHRTIHSVCLLLAAFLMPVSVWLLSAVSIAMSINWLLEGDFEEKRSRLKTQPGLIYLVLLFAMYLAWLLNTSDFPGALAELRLKLPLLFFPVVLGSVTPAGPREMRMVLLAFIGGCVFSASAGFLALAGVLPAEINNPRDLALFVPSIRLSILLNFGIFTSLWLSLTPTTGGTALRTVLAVATAVMALFLFRLLSVTGIVLFVALLGGTGLYIALGKKRVVAGISRMAAVLAGISLMAAAAAVTTASVMLVTSAWGTLRNPLHPEVNDPLTVTSSGNSYTHYPEETLVENGYLVWVNVCSEELRREWNRRSSLPYDGNDKAGNELRTTLVRYITSMGLPKDSAAVAALDEVDILNIESGYANPVYAKKGSPRARAYELAWEIDRAARGGNPSGHSLTQRPEFYRAASGIIRENPWTGVGTGDVGKAFKEEYEKNATPLGMEYRLRAHNQYLTFGVTFGIPGMIFGCHPDADAVADMQWEDLLSVHAVHLRHFYLYDK